MRNIFTRLWVVSLLLLVTATVSAQLSSLEVGQVYRFVSARADRSLSADGVDDVHTKTTDAADTKQEWYVTKEGDYYVLRNLACGKYLKGAQSAYTAWSMTDDYSHEYNKFELYTSNATLNTLKTKGSDGYGYMHDDNNGDNGGYNIVGWLNGNDNTGTHWTITKVNYTTDEITALLEKAPTVAESAAYVTSLEAIFSDAACTILKSAYTTTSMTDEQLAADANYSELPQTLKNMVKKVRGGNWAEETVALDARPNGNNSSHGQWDVYTTWEHDYAKKFRVQMYEPYSVEGEITSFLGINAHCNMDNPTGIYANAGEPIYIMVEGDIAEGAELWVAHQTGHGVTNSYNNAAYTQLKKGLNVIPYTSDGCQLWINYLVHTYNKSTGEFPHKLSDYKPLKIHIEGGHINGFFNAMGDFRSTEVTGDANGGENLWGEVDNDADWDYYKARAALATDFALLGHRQTLLFPFGTWNSTNGYFGVANEGGGIEKALAWHLENIEVPTTPNCYAGSGNAFGDFSDTYYPGMNLDAETGKINIMLEAWDRIMYSEHATMGLLSKSNIDKMNRLYPGWTAENTTFDIYNYGSNDTGDTYKAFCEGRDYGDYYNHHGAAVGSGSGYMSGGWRVCNYHYNTMGSIIGKIAVEAGPTWGPAHEIGHQHQSIFNLNGQTEVTNNFFSNVAVWYMGMGTSRVNGTEGSLASVLDAFNTEDNDLYTNNIWAITHLYYRLWLYYHLAGNNTQFWPRLFELLRQTPMANGGQISGETSLLRFYQHACDAAGEDLTEFFRAHGFFELMTNRLVGDYSNAIYNVTEEQIETAITAVKEKNYPVNYAVLLINDATSETETTLKHDGTTKRALWDDDPSAEYGSVTDFIEGNTSVTEAYTAIVGNDGTITMSGGEGGVGFLVFNENGELVSFSNKSTFELSDEAKKTILQGNATFVAVDSENNTTTAEIDLTEMQKTILGELIAKAQQIVDKIDNTYTKIGFYKGAAVADLAAALENAKTVYDAGTSGYGAAYDLLYAEYNKLLENEDARIPFDPSLTYIITNKEYTNQTMWVNDALTVRSEGGVDQTADAAKWQFKATASDGVYNIYNKKGYYCPAVAQSTAMTATTTANADALYTLQEMEAGVWAIKLSPAASLRNFHSSWNNVVGWETGNNASRWYLTAVEPNATIADLTNLEVYITKTEALLGEVLGTVTYTKGENIALQTTTEGSAGYIWSNAPHSEGPIANLVDGVTTNYFHTDWQSSGDVTSGDHYIAVDLGAGNTLPRFAFSHTTRSGATNDFPKSVDVYGSDDNVTYKYLGSASDMPQSAGTFWQFDGMIISSHRYLRFNMHANRGYWHMAEFDIMPVTSFTATLNNTYSGTVDVETLTDALEALYNGKSVTLSMSPTKADIDEKLEVLRPAYEALYTEYSAAITARKNTLAQLAANTQNLINQAGTVEIIPTIEAKLQTTEPDGDFYVSTNAQSSQEGPIANLVDGDNSTFFHSDYSGNNSSDGLDHSINIKLGEANATKLFEFSYVTRHNAETNYPTAMTVYGSTNGTDYEMINSFTGLPTSNTATYGPVLIECSKEYTYLRFMVTENSSNTDKGGHPFFHMAEFDLTTIGSTTTTINSTYKSVVSQELLLSSVHTTNSSAAMSTNALVTSVPMLDAQIADQQAAYDKLNEAMQQATCDKTALVEYLVTANNLYEEFSEDDAIAPYYATSSVTLEQITALKEAIDASNAVVANDAAIQTAVDDALATLKAKAQVLEDIKADDYSGSRETIGTEITNAATLLAEVMTAAEAPETVVLQNGNATQPYYIWCNKPANDSHGIAGGLIDKNDDGTANTSTFFGTYWNDGAVEPYAHYLEIDLGCVKSIENFAFDYTTRASGYENQRPNGIKVLVSNDKDVYNQVLAVTDGLAAGANEKWELDAPFGFVGRYVRFAVSSQKGYFNMSDFNISFDAAYSLQEYYTTSGIDANLLTTLNDAVQQAVKARDCFVTEEMYNTAIANLAEAYNSLNTFKSAHISERTELGNLADTAETLVTEVATINETETAITMQCTDENAPYYLYCNAAGTENGGTDALGVAALVGDKATNTEHLHTAYRGSTDDDLDHYLRLDMGENKAMMSFKFSYTGRNSGNNNDPTVMLIEGSNDLENFEFITKLTDLPTSPTPTTYSSGVLGNGKAYRYIRFMVIETNNNAKYKDHPYFVLSQFAVTACKTIEVKSEYQSINLPLSKLVTANNEVVDAKAVVAENEHYLTETAYNEALDELQAAYNALNVAKDAQNIPVILTTDVNNPVLYKIKIKRSDTSVLEFDGAADATNMVAVDNDELGNEYQAWYFMQGTDADSNDDLLILPYWRAGEHNTTYRLASNSIGDGNSKVKAVDGTDDTYKQNWYITFTDSKTVADWWNIQPEGKATYFSNHGGTNNKMGFWADSAQSPGDDGSNFQFVLDETDYSKSDAYFDLYNLHADCGGEKVSGEAIGCYTASTVETYNNAYNAATEKLADADATDDDYNSARTALEDAYNALTRNMPVLGGFYKIRSAYKTADDGDTYSSDGVVYADDDNNVYWAKDYDITSARAIWYIEPIEGGYNIKNMHTGCSFTTLLWAEAATLSTTPATFTIDVLDDATGILKIVSGQPMHAQASGNKVVGYSGGLNTASAWTIEEVSVDDVVANIEHTITLAANTTGNDQATGYSTLNLGYPVTVPAGVTAYIVTNSAIVDNTIELYEYASEGATIPANFPVILRGSIEESAGRAFKFNNAAVAAVDNVDNLLGGSNYTTYESCLDENGDNVYNIYMLTRKSGIVAMRWVYENYRADKTNTGNNDDGGYVKCPANKVYLKLGGATTQNLSTEYFFGIFSGTTDIDEVNTEENPLEGTVYDLQGRKIEEVVVPGFYIVNGKKVFINSELLK
ncbi:MAG: discoidin domain-containing protein [Bacteroidaceae bacterium]|nr:discoidin domain-containing protein [Bacteroidaceae bacterium]